MNESILELWRDTGIISVRAKDYPKLLKFVKYMDKNSLWLVKYDPETETYLFSNDGQRITFTLQEILQHITNMENGISFPWNTFRDC